MKIPKNFIERIEKNRKVLANGKEFRLQAQALQNNGGPDYSPLWVFGGQSMQHCLLIKLYWEANSYAVIMPKKNHSDRGPIVATGWLRSEFIQSFDDFKTVFLQPLIEQRIKANINQFN